MKSNVVKIFLIVSLVVLVIGINIYCTFFSSDDDDSTKIVTSIGSATITFDGGSDINVNFDDLRLLSDKINGIEKNINVKADTAGLVLNLYLDITRIARALKDVNFRYELYRGSTRIKEGNFSDSYLDSNGITCTTSDSKHLVLLADENISARKSTYTLYVWIDDEDYVNTDTTSMSAFNFELHVDGEEMALEKTAAQIIEKEYIDAPKMAVTNNNINYSYANIYDTDGDKNTSGGLMSDIAGNVRYYGANPNNYIYFNCRAYPSTNCELWRIIGVFDGKLKIIRNTPIESLAWDQDKNNGSSRTTYDNKWTTATLQKLLNDKYYNGDKSGTITYYSSADFYIETTLNMGSIGLKNDKTRNLIEKVTWNIAGWNNTSVYPNQMYIYERRAKTLGPKETKWEGKIGLTYPSDYGYAADFSECSEQLKGYNDATCANSNWLFNGNCMWLLAPDSDNGYRVWNVNLDGSLDIDKLSYERSLVFPVLYLHPKQMLNSGVGTLSNPYKLSA